MCSVRVHKAVNKLGSGYGTKVPTTMVDTYGIVLSHYYEISATSLVCLLVCIGGHSSERLSVTKIATV